MNTEGKEGSKLILITGATGTIGRTLVDVLVDEGADIRAVTRNPKAAGLPADVLRSSKVTRPVPR